MHPNDRFPPLSDEDESDEDLLRINFSEYRDTQEQRKRRCGVVVVIIGVLSLLVTAGVVGLVVSMNGGNSVLGNYFIKSSALSRPDWWLAALHDAQIKAQSGGQMNYLRDGSVLWTFGDTLVNCTPHCEHGQQTVMNSGLLIKMNSNGSIAAAQYAVDAEGVATHIIPYQQDEDTSLAIWPRSAVLVDSQVFIFWEVVSRAAGGQHVAYGRGVGSPHFETTLNFTRITADDKSAQYAPTFSVLLNDYVYFYILRGDDDDEGKDVLLARVPKDSLHAAALRYEFWTGKADVFSSDVSYEEAASVLEDWRSASLSVQYNYYLKQYVLIAAGAQIALRTSKNLWGPWSDPVNVFSVPAAQRGAAGSVFAAVLHPELWTANGQVMVFSYCLDGGNGDRLPYLVQLQLEPKKEHTVFV